MTKLSDVILRDTRANQPAAGTAGRLYYVTDENVTERDSGSAWEDYSDAGGGGGGGSSDLWTLIYDQIANGTDNPIDFKITSGDYVVLGYFKGNSTSGWSDPTNAVHTVTGGKTLIVLQTFATDILVADTGNRQARLQNTTDNTTVVGADRFQAPYGPGTIPYSGDGGGSTLDRVAAGKTVKLQLWNNGSSTRSMGAGVICKEI